MTKLKFTGHTSIGKVREKNEDAHGYSSDESFFFVCDGMGGHAAGEFASSVAVNTIQKYMSLSASDTHDLAGFLSARYPSMPPEMIKPSLSVFITNRRLYQLAVQNPSLRGMGTTIAAVYFTESRAYMLHVGDSRVYLFRNKKLDPLTMDHSWVNELLQDNEISRDEASSFKKKNVVTRVLGTQHSVKIDFSSIPVEPDDYFLICSDGLTGPVPDEKIRGILQKHLPDVNAAATGLVSAADKAGGPDNSTVLLIRCADISQSLATATEKSAPVITINDNDDAFHENEDVFIKKHIPTVSLAIPKELPPEKKPLKQHFFIYGIIMLLTGIAATLSYSLYKNIEKKNHPEKYTTAALGPSMPASQTGTVEVVTEPSGAEIYLNDSSTPAGVSPFTVQFNDLDPEGNNTHQFNIKKRGYQEITVSRDVIINDTITMTLDLVPESIVELYLGIDAQFPDTARIELALSSKPQDTRELTTINKLQNIAYNGGIQAGKYHLTITNNDTVLWNYSFTAYARKKVKIYINNEKGDDTIHYEEF